MAWSKTTRISIMLGIDIAFFLLELIAAYAVGSLALMADAFHMLNDIISLMVGLWAVSVARKATTDKYSYGWLRAEILGAFFNAVFLIALCVSIVLEASVRLIDPPTINHPQLILIVGSFGLASNLFGFVVLGGHGHSHGHGEHAHGEHDHDEHEHAHGGSAEQGRAGLHNYHDPNGPVTDVLPEAAVARFQNASTRLAESRSDPGTRCANRAPGQQRGRDRRRSGSVRHSRFVDSEPIIHPASFRQQIIERDPNHHAHFEDDGGSETADEHAASDDEVEANAETPLLKSPVKKYNGIGRGARSASRRPRRNSGVHEDHNHNKPEKAIKKTGKHSHSHGDMGMNAMVLHVLGDALGNVGVIITALIIWLTDWPGKNYADPVVSLVITLIILRTAIPLTAAASRILLQATPDSIDLNDVREDIQALPGVVSCHHVHVWQLSDTRIVASMHIQVEFAISADDGERYMTLAKMARKCLHAYGIHSATIQPEFCLENHGHGLDGTPSMVAPNQPGCGYWGNDYCLLECVDGCGSKDKGCCAAMGTKVRVPSGGTVVAEEEHWHDPHVHKVPSQHGHGHAHR